MPAQLPPHRVGRPGGAASSASLPIAWGGKEGMLAQLPPHRVGRPGGDASSAPSPPRREARRGYQLSSLPTAWGGQEGMLAQLPPHRVGRLGGAASSASLPTGWGGKEGMLAQLLLAAGHGDVAVERRAVLDGEPAHAHVTVEPAGPAQGQAALGADIAVDLA